VLEQLDDRCVPAVFDVPWYDPRHLTLSFAPDGTGTSNGASNLFQSFDAQLPQAVWEGEILQAVQAWSSVANINVGVVTDGSEAFGTPGAIQGDSRFGDIRIGGAPMALSTLAMTTPSDPFLSGTLAGDILFNTAVNLTDPNYNLYSVALHEVGHALGLPDTSDPASVMFETLQARPGQLAPEDVAAIQALYGPPVADPNAVAAGTSPLLPATNLVPATPGVATGQVPLVAYGDLTTVGTADAFSFQTPQGPLGPMNLRVRTAGISLLEATVNLYDSTGTLVASGTMSDPTGGEVVLSVPTPAAGSMYYVQISGAAGPFATGRYALAVSYGPAAAASSDDSTTGSSDQAPGVSTTRLESVLQGPYDTWSATDVANLLVGIRPASPTPANTTPATALPLTTASTIGGLPTYQAVGTLHGEGATVYYEVVTPNATGTTVLSAAVSGLGAHGGTPRIQLFDSLNQRVHVDVLSSANGTYTIQATGLAANQTYYLRVSGGDDGAGGYGLTVSFNQPPTLLEQVSSGQLTPTSPTVGNTLFVAKPQLFFISLSASMSGDGEDDSSTAPTTPPPPPTVQMAILNATGAVVLSLAATPGQTTSAAILLAPGQYAVNFTGPATGITVPLNFTVHLAALSDPVGPQVYDTTSEPLYVSPTNPYQFLYPVGIVTQSFYLWIPVIY
jgi:hypothetical protein